MSTTSETEVPRLVASPRETYLRKDETKIRSDAAHLAKNDPAIKRQLDAVEMAEDLFDYHETAIQHFRSRDLKHRIPPHERYKSQALQLKLNHLDQLAHLII